MRKRSRSRNVVCIIEQRARHVSHNSFGQNFRFTTWGESHGPALGAVVDGCPPGLPLSQADIQPFLDARRPGTSRFTTQRAEPDTVRILSGVFEGRTTGTPISLMIENVDQRSKDYGEIAAAYRPGHADYAYDAKYGLRDYRGGGRSSARETVGRVAAGAIAKKILAAGTGSGGVEIRAFLTQVHDIAVPPEALAGFPTLAEVEATAVRCPHLPTAAAMIERIKAVRSEGDSVGGVIECRVRGVPAGLGAPVFDRLEADLAKVTEPEAFVRAVFERLLGREPKEGELRESIAYLSGPSKGRESLVHVLLNHNDFVTVR